MNLQISKIESFFDAKELNNIVELITTYKGVEVWWKREDLLHDTVSGNKFRKLKYYLLHFFEKNSYKGILSVGGAYSNHILALAAAGKQFGFETIGIIRGEELENKPLNNKLKQAKEYGMKLIFVTRNKYREIRDTGGECLTSTLPGNLFVPEGGSGSLGKKGCLEITSTLKKTYDYIFCACGTGTTIAGIIESMPKEQKIIGVSSFKENFLQKDVEKYLNNPSKVNWQIDNRFHFGGYAKTPKELELFIQILELKYNIKVDRVYNHKVLYAIFDGIEKGRIKKGEAVLMINTGGIKC